MDELVKRLRDWQTVHPCDADKPEGHLYEESAARIEQLEARVAAADKLAEAAGDLSLSKYGLKACRVRNALAAYEATKEQSE